MAITSQINRYPGGSDLWIEQESVVISANSQPTWDFYPEFLLNEGIVPSDWLCSQHTRDSEKVEVRIGPSTWQMFDANLWISTFPDLPLEMAWREDYGDEVLASPILAHKFLNAVPALPARRFWYFWRINVIVDHPLETLADLFGHPSVSAGFRLSDLRSTFGMVQEGHHFSVNVSGGQVQQQGERLSGLTFECYATFNRDALVSEMIAECARLLDRLEVFRQFIIGFFPESRGPDAENP